MQGSSIEKFIMDLSKQNYEHTVKFNEIFKREFIKDLITRNKQQILVHNTTYTVDRNDNIKKIGETTYELTRTNRNNKHNIRKNVKLQSDSK